MELSPPRGPERYRPSLAIILQGARARTPSHLNYANRTFNQARQILSSLQTGPTGMPSFSGTTGTVARGGSEFERLVAAIAGKESSGNYGAVNRSSGALGKYQIMPSNLPSWSRKYIGRVVSPQEFLRNPQIQEAIARGQLMDYYRKYGPAGAATAWYAGPGAVSRMNSTRSQGAYPSIQAYWQDILRRMGR